jgi:microcystin-dependent protein
MTNYFLGQIGIYGFNFAPRGWATASGQILSIAQNTALFSLLGTTYGGNGQTTFGLPDMRGRAALHFDGNYPQGEMSGVESVTLLTTEIPSHRHLFEGSSALADATFGTGHIFGQGNTGAPPGTAQNTYAAGPPAMILNPQTVALYGGNQPHSNMQPYLTVNYCISTTGIFPSRN